MQISSEKPQRRIQTSGRSTAQSSELSDTQGAEQIGSQHNGVSTDALVSVTRPMVPYLLLPLLLIWAALAAAERFVWLGASLPPWLFAVVGFVLLGLSQVVAVPKKFEKIKLVQKLPSLMSRLALLSLSFALGLGNWSSVSDQRALLEQNSPTELTARVISDPQLGSISTASIVEIRTTDGESYRCRIFWPRQDIVPAYGSTVTVLGSFRPLSEYQEFLFRQGIVGSFSAKAISSSYFAESLLGRIAKYRADRNDLLSKGETSGDQLLSGVLLGNASKFNAGNTGEAFRITGLSHLVAVSGSHLAAIASMLVVMLRRFKLTSAVEVFTLSVLVVCYVLLTAVQPSALRAASMLFMLQSSRLVGKRAHAASAVTTTACLMILIQPATVFSLGFWLSVFAVFGIAVYLPLCLAWLQSAMAVFGGSKLSLSNAKTKKLEHYLLEPMALSIVAQLSTLPLAVPVFATVSLIALPANLLVAPLITLMLIIGLPGLVLSSLIPPLEQPVVMILRVLAKLICWLAESLARIPSASTPCDVQFWFCLCFAVVLAAWLYRYWPLPTTKRLKALGATALLLAVLFTALALRPHPAEMIVLDIGQGDAIIVRDGNNTILIDTGPDPTRLRRALARNQVGSLDALILSHLDSDHTGALSALSGTVQPGAIYFASGLLEARPDAVAITDALSIVGSDSLFGLMAGDTLILSEHMNLSVLLPLNSVSNGDNDDSLVLSLNYIENDEQLLYRVLLTGDAEAQTLAVICWRYSDLRFVAMKVAHHGSRQATSYEQLVFWDCEIALISVGADNHYGHPNSETLQTLTEANVSIYRTDELGDIHIRFTTHGLDIHYSNNNFLWSY